MENIETQIICGGNENETRSEEYVLTSSTVWEADFFQITAEGQEVLQKVANPQTL
jgi:hypothetical protein